MARTMKKFSAGGAQGRYDRRMADIEKDFKKNSAGKSGKALEVLEAKRMQRTADAKDDLAKRTGADRTATRAAERAAESNLTKTRKYGAPQAVSKLEPVASEKITETLSLPKPGLATSTKKAPAKAPAKAPVKTPVKTDKPQLGTHSRMDAAYQSQRDRQRARNVRGGSNSGSPTKGTIYGSEPLAGSKFDKAAFSDLKTGKNSYGATRIGKTGGTKTDTKGTGTSRVARAADPKDTSAAASRARFGAAMSYLNPFSYIENVARRRDPSEVNKAKGGKVKKEKTMKYRSGGSISSKPPQPTAADRKSDAKFRKSVKDLKVTPESAAAIGRGNRSTGMAKGGKMAPKFGAAMKKKSADTKGRAMMKKAGGGKCYAKGGSIDGIAKKGKTKATMVKMARGGSALMRSRDSYGGANFKKGGKC
jgi:hypothetical protein